MKLYLAPAICCTLLAAPLHLADGPGVQPALDHINADSLRGNLSFLASDALEGRDTPSRGLDIAAEFIASQFRRAGLEAPVNGSYFQTADFVRLIRQGDGLSLVFEKHNSSNPADVLAFGPTDVTVTRTNSPMNIDSAPIYKLSGGSVPAEVAGKAVLITSRRDPALFRRAREKRPALIVTTGRSGPMQMGTAGLVAADQPSAATTPQIAVGGEAASKFFDSLPEGLTGASLTIHAPGPRREPIQLRNVIGVLRGSDPELSNTYIIVSAHYDHLGTKPQEGDADSSDRIYNGANDDGSGVVSVIELAGALASMHPRPRRSIVFMTVFGEEKGLLGSQYYSRHPVFPLQKTVADINIEQLGRTDDTEGPQVGSATFTGFQYSDLPALFADAGKNLGIKVYDRNPGNDPYFDRSDNQALAEAGIPSHTVAVSLEFGDYHRPGDEWQKIDYTNMTAIDRMLGLGIISLANDPEPPKWNESNQNNQKYLAAWKRLLAAPQN